jgi:glutamyl-tRNA reductase
MRTLVIGCNHRTAPVEVRERLSFDPASCADALSRFRQRFPCCEAVLLSTCNRTELYVSRPVHGHPRIEEAIAFLAESRRVDVHEFSPSAYHYEDAEALRHLFHVAGSIDSMILGESQILAQVKAAFGIAREVGMAGRQLDAIFQRAFAVAKEIHTRTGVSSGRTSVGGTAVEFARQIFSHFDDKTVLLIGAGEMGEVTLQHLLEMKPKCVLLTNRTPSRAESVRERIIRPTGLRGEVVPFERLPDHLVEADIVISTTGAPEPILRRAALNDLPHRRGFRPLLMIDIAVPRDIEPEVGKLENVFVYNIDDLQSVAEKNIAARQKQLARCEEIIEIHVQEFVAWQQSREVGPTITALQKRFGEIGQQELERVIPKLSQVSDHDRELLTQMLHRITQKLLHGPSMLLRDKAAAGRAHLYADTLRNMFGLKDEQ